MELDGSLTVEAAMIFHLIQMINLTKAKGSTAFFILLIANTIMVLVMIRSFLGVIFFSLTLVFILKPLFDRLVISFLGRKNLAVAATLMITAMVPFLYSALRISFFINSCTLGSVSNRNIPVI